MSILITHADPNSDYDGGVIIRISQRANNVAWDWDSGLSTVSLGIEWSDLRELRDAIIEFLGADQ